MFTRIMSRLVPRSFPARTVVGVAGATVLVVETLAARLVAPFVGLTLETYTAAIGVALLGVALGAKFGGTLADRHGPLLVVTGALTVGGIAVLLVRPVVLLLGPPLPPGPVSAILLVGVGTLPAVTVLSMVAPAAVKYRLHHLNESGRIVGEMSAAGTIGALAGTVLTGYVLVAALPTWGVLAVAGGGCIALALLVAATSEWMGLAGPMLGAALALALAATALVGVRSPCEVETAYYCASVVTDPERPTGRILMLNDLRHSYVDLADPAYLEFDYVKTFAAVVDAAAPAGKPLEAVHVGGGGFTMPRWLAATRPGSTSVVLELDREVVDLGLRRLGVGDIADTRVITGDARVSLRRLPANSADLIVGDAFGSLSVPWHLATREYLQDVRRVLRPRGVLVINIIDYGPKRFLAAESRTAARVFDQTALISPSGRLDRQGGGNFVLAASPHRLPTSDLAAELGARGIAAAVLTGAELTTFAQAGPLLTDDFAPVDQLLTPYRLTPKTEHKAGMR